MIRKLVHAARTWIRHRREPLRLEFVLTDHCNLNCKGCTHYSPLAPKEFEDIDTLSKSMMHLGQIAGHKIRRAYLIGGEPLLYPQLTEAMAALRLAFPKARLYIFTNGIALPGMKTAFWNACRRLHYTIAVTRYPIRFDYDAAIELCNKEKVECEVFGDRSMADSFFRFTLDPEGRQNPRMSHFKCYNFGCLSVMGNKLYPCSISACVKHLNNACGTSFTHTPADWLNVSDITSVKEIKNLRNRPVPFCRYCILPPATVKYCPSRREACEWL